MYIIRDDGSWQSAPSKIKTGNLKMWRDKIYTICPNPKIGDIICIEDFNYKRIGYRAINENGYYTYWERVSSDYIKETIEEKARNMVYGSLTHHQQIDLDIFGECYDPNVEERIRELEVELEIMKKFYFGVFINIDSIECIKHEKNKNYENYYFIMIDKFGNNGFNCKITIMDSNRNVKRLFITPAIPDFCNASIDVINQKDVLLEINKYIGDIKNIE